MGVCSPTMLTKVSTFNRNGQPMNPDPKHLLKKGKSSFSPHKDEIENLIRNGYLISSVHAYISEKYGLNVSKKSFFSFVKRNVKDERKKPQQEPPVTSAVLPKTTEQNFSQFSLKRPPLPEIDSGATGELDYFKRNKK